MLVVFTSTSSLESAGSSATSTHPEKSVNRPRTFVRMCRATNSTAVCAGSSSYLPAGGAWILSTSSTARAISSAPLSIGPSTCEPGMDTHYSGVAMEDGGDAGYAGEDGRSNRLRELPGGRPARGPTLGAPDRVGAARRGAPLLDPQGRDPGDLGHPPVGAAPRARDGGDRHPVGLALHAGPDRVRPQ